MSKQTTVMNLGKLALPRKQWPELALLLESMINKQIVMDGAFSSAIMDLAKECMKSNKVYPQVTVTNIHSKEKPPRNVDMREIKVRNKRTLGPELVCQWAWDKLQISSILKKANFTQKDIGMARAAVFGRMIYPGSERRTYAWAQDRSSLFEFPDFDVSQYGIDQFYNISDMVYNAKKTIEDELYSIENKLFPPSDNVVFHYDLTNTYFEGGALRNTCGKRGKSKEKRTDCPLMSLSLAVRNDGFPVYSCIYSGNQPEPIIEMLQCEKFDYVVVRREDETKNYKDIFKNGRETFDVVSEGLVFHQTNERSSAHIFVTLLAYHLVIAILNTLSKHGDKRSWATLRDILFTHCRFSLFHEDKLKGKAVNIRMSGVPEEEHLEIYKKLGITDYLKNIETVEYLD
ncbi:MAG: hypothetical protein LBT59_06965 [Clostridiales bacterium]|nr:hypothetical protein [Clostridiales bacterium]